MRRAIATFSVLGLSWALGSAGCGGTTESPSGTTSTGSTGSTGSGGGAGTVTIQDFPALVAKVYCGAIYACCTPAEVTAFFDPQPKDEAECASNFSTFYDTQVLTEIKEAIGAGRAAYDGASAAACYATIAGDCAVAQASSFPDIPACHTIFVGKVPDGGNCKSDNECASDAAFCIFHGNTAFGACVSPGPAGAPCGLGKECQSTYCDAGTSQCKERSAVGAPCTVSDECKDSYCGGAPTVCTARKVEGKPCSSYDECQSGECGTSSHVCAPKPVVCDGK
jgi:hypothetical protein